MSPSKVLLLLCLILSIIPTAQATIHTDTIENGDLESWSSEFQPASWTKSAYSVERSSSTHYEGSYSAQLGSGGYILQTCNMSISYGYGITYTAHHYDKGAEANTTMDIIFYDSGASVISTESIIMDDTYYWGEYAGTVYAPANAETVAIKFTGGTGLGYNYVDGVSVSINDVPPSPPLYLTIKNESDLSTINNATATVSDGSTEVEYSTTTGIISIPSSEGLTGECTLSISSTDYDARHYTLEEPGNLTAYLSPSSDNVLVQFSLIDYTNTFNYRETRLILSRLTGAQSITVSDTYFDASGVCSVFLRPNNYYSLQLQNDITLRGIGSYVPLLSDSISLVVGEVELVPESSDYAGFNYTLTKTNESISFSWIAPEGSLSADLNYTIFDSNDTIVYTLESDSLSGTASYTYADPSAQYKIVLSVPTTDGTLSHTEYVSGETKLIDLQISEKWYNMISIFILFIIALTFGAKSASAGALITSLSAVGLFAIGMLHCDVLIISLCIILGVLAVLRGRGA